MVNIDDIKNIMIVGAGFMGYGIAHFALMAGFDKIVINAIIQVYISK
ncbi:MAG: hypothetical protein ACFFBY_08185 [Promethearchaeota archaeon]